MIWMYRLMPLYKIYNYNYINTYGKGTGNMSPEDVLRNKVQIFYHFGTL